MFRQKLCQRCDVWAGMLSWWSCQSPVSHSCGLLNHLVSSGECSSFTQNLMKICALLAQSFWMWWPHTTYAHSMASTAPPTSTVKFSLFTHAHSSPTSLAARLYWCCANHSCYINNGWTLSRQTSQILLLSLFYRWGYRNAEKLCHLSKIIEKNGDEIHTMTICFHSLH